MKHSTKLLVIIATAVSTIAFAGAGWALWSTSGSGSASRPVGSLNAPTITTATWSGSTGKVTVGWTAPAAGAVPSGYYVQRDGSNVCGNPAGPLTATTCIDSDVPGDSHTYTVTAVFNSWTTPASTSVVVTPSVAIPSGQSVAAGGTIAATLHGFRSVGTIAFRLDNATGTPITTTAPASVATPAGSGSASATLTIPGGATAGTHTIYAAGSLGDSATSSNTFTVTVTVTATKFAFTSTPVTGSASASATLGPITVQAQDASGNPVNAGGTGIPVSLGSTATAKFAAISAGTSVTAVTIPSGSSTVSFYYADTKAGSPVITASGSLSSATQTETISAAAASQLVFTTQPGSDSATGALSPQPAVSVEDSFGNVVTGDSTTTVKLAPGTATGPLVCYNGSGSSTGLTKPVSSGVATFSGCAVTAAATGDTLKATSSPAHGTVTSSPFNVTISTPTVTFPTSTSKETVPNGTTATFTVSGTNFASGVQIAISGTGDFIPTSWTWIDATHISVTTTAQNGTGHKGTSSLTVTNPDGGTVTSASSMVNS
jgi:hypothetical protein